MQLIDRALKMPQPPICVMVFDKIKLTYRSPKALGIT